MELLTYDCPFTGRKRCALDAGLESFVVDSKRVSIAEDARLV